MRRRRYCTRWIDRLTIVAGLLVIGCLDGCGKSERPPVTAKSPAAADASVEATEPKLPIETVAPESTEPIIEEPEPAAPTSVAMSPTKTPDKRMVIPDKQMVITETDTPPEPVEEPPDEPIEPAPLSEPVASSTADEDSLVRLFLPTTSGLLLVGVEIRIGDKRLDDVFDEQIDTVIAEANDDPETALTWRELFAHVAADPEQFGRRSIPNSGQYRDLIRRYDLNRNQQPDAQEVAKFLFRNSLFAGPFRLRGSDYFRSINRSKSAVFIAIDTNEDGALQTNEREHASDALLGLDENSDGRIDIDEATLTVSDDNLAWNRRRSNRRGDVALDLAGYVDWSMVSYALDGMMKETPFGLKRNLVAQLDQDASESISGDEAKTLLSLQPHLTLRVDFSSGSAATTSVQIVSAQSELQSLVSTRQTPNQVFVSDESLCFTARVTDVPRNRDRIPYQVFAMLDANDDGGLDESEIPAGAADEYSLEDLDQDDDGKLTIIEINTRPQSKLPYWGAQIRGRAAEIPDAVFAWLDQNQDQFLSSREINEAGTRLNQCADNKERVAPSDIPDTFLLQFVRGNPEQDNQLFSMSRPTEYAAEGIPKWAQHMDVNRDGDISWQEFPGSRPQFDALDTNQDSFIDLPEVRQSAEQTSD